MNENKCHMGCPYGQNDVVEKSPAEELWERLHHYLLPIEDGCIEIRKKPNYAVPLDRIKTPEQILGWLDHLMSKQWFTQDLAHRFLLTAVGHLKLTIHPV